MRQKVRTNGLDIAARRLGQSAQDLEVLLAAVPGRGEAGEREMHDRGGGHGEYA